MIGGLGRIDALGACFFTPAAVNAFIVIHLQVHARDFIEQSVDTADRAEKTAEGPVSENCKQQHCSQESKGDREPDSLGSFEKKRNSGSLLPEVVYGARGAEIAEEHRSRNVRNGDHEADKDRYAEMARPARQMELLNPDLMKKILCESEGTQPSAPPCPEGRAEQNENGKRHEDRAEYPVQRHPGNAHSHENSGPLKLYQGAGKGGDGAIGALQIAAGKKPEKRKVNSVRNDERARLNKPSVLEKCGQAGFHYPALLRIKTQGRRRALYAEGS